MQQNYDTSEESHGVYRRVFSPRISLDGAMIDSNNAQVYVFEISVTDIEMDVVWPSNTKWFRITRCTKKINFALEKE